MQYIGTNEVGFDAVALGFPSVMTCQAITYKTSFGLYGFHDALTNDMVFTRKCEAFAQFAQNIAMTHPDHGECLIGVINREERFTKDRDVDWATQLLEVAQHLRFEGPIFGARLDGHLGRRDSAYIRFDAAPDSSPPCHVSYKRWSKMEFDSKTKLKDYSQLHALLRPVSNVYTTEFEKNNRPMALMPTTEDNRPVQRIGQTDEGTLNQVTKFIQFR